MFVHAKTAPEIPVQDKPIRTIVIDAGHGGNDVGARGKYSYEKDISLDVALKLGKIIEEAMPDVKVVYTRKTDRFDDVHRKAAIANEAQGDLFISIHCNAAAPLSRVSGYKTVTYRDKKKRKRTKRVPVYEKIPNPAQGTETYIWATSKNNAKAESLRNSSVIVLDANSEETQQLLGNDPETLIMLNTLRNVFFDQSYRLSNLVQDEFSKAGRINRGARQRNEKGILVLHATAMPSVLVELGFISNPEEENYLNSADGQNEMAQCIYRAVRRYKEELEKVYNTAEAGRKHNGPAAAPQQPAAAPAVEPPVKDAPTLQPKNEPSVQPGGETGSQFKVQLMTTEKLYARGHTIFGKLDGTIEREDIKQGKKKLHKYIWGGFRTEAEAHSALYKARKQGFKDAFVVTYRNGERIEQ
ncbi:N-acetylmuramoyl-L-alanine amidase family protein [Chitinophaga lutea]